MKAWQPWHTQIVVLITITFALAGLAFGQNAPNEDKPDAGSTWDPSGPDPHDPPVREQTPETATAVITCDDEPHGRLTLRVSLPTGSDARECTRSVPDDYDFVVITNNQGDTVTAEHGDSVTGIVRGTKGLPIPEVHQHHFSAFNGFSDVTFSVRDNQKALVAKTKITLLHHYWINLGLGVILGSGVTTYAVANKTVQEVSPSVDISYDAMFHFYFGSRVFDYRYDECYRRLSVVLGFQVSSPTTGVFVGLGYELFPGATVVFGVQPRQIQRLRPGVVLGAPNADSSVPVDTVWNGRFIGGGISFDVNIAKAVIGAFK